MVLGSLNTSKRWIDKVHWESVGVLAVILAGIAARSWQIRYSFEDDEIFSASLASSNIADVLVRSLRDATHPPLYNILLHVWLSLFGTSELSARALSVLFACGFLVFAYRLLRRYLEPWLALATLAVFALSPFFVYYGQQVRPYSLIGMLSAANLYLFFRVMDAPDGRWPVRVWALSAVALVYSQYIGVLFVAGQIVYAIYCLRAGAVRIFKYGAAAMLSVMPWLISAILWSPAARTDPLHQISWMTPPTPKDLVWFYATLFGTRYPIRWLVLVLGLLAAAYAYRKVTARRIPHEHVLILVMAVGLPLFVYALSVWGPKPVFVSRQLTGAALAFLMVVGVMLGSLPRPYAAAAVLFLVGWCAASVPAALPRNMNTPWRDTAEWIARNYGSRGVLVGDSTDQPHLRYYRKEGDIAFWREMPEAKMEQGFLLLCRPHFCAKAGREVAGRATLVKSWRWDLVNGDAALHQLMLFDVHPRSLTRTIGAAGQGGHI